MKSQDDILKTLNIMQHHDAITGTHMNRVRIDYEKMMVKARDDALGAK